MSLRHSISSKEDLLQAIFKNVHALTTTGLLLDRLPCGTALDRLWAYFLGHIRFDLDYLHASTLFYRDIRFLGLETRAAIMPMRDEPRRFAG